MIEKLLKHKYLYLLFLGILIAIALIKVPFIQVDTDISQFFNEDDTDYRLYQEMKSEFSSQENMIVLAVKSKDSIFNSNFIHKTSILSDSIEKTPHIKKVKSLLNASFPIKSAFGISGIPYLKKQESGAFTYNKDNILNDELSKNFINKNADALFLWIEIEPNLTAKDLNKLIDSINKIRTETTELETFLWGRKVIDVSFKNLLIEEILTFGVFIFIFLCLSFAFIFKRTAALFFPISLVLIIILLFIGGMATLGRPISTLSNLFPTIILIVAVSDVVHLCIKYDLESKKGLNSKQATKNALKEIGFTTLVTSLTTAIGFLVLYLSPMQAIRNFGVESASLVILTFILTLIFLPIFFSSIKSENLFAISKPFDTLSSFVFLKLDSLYKHPKAVLILFSVILLISSYGITLIKTNNTLYSIPNNSELHKSYTFFDTNFGGSRTFELLLFSKNEEKLNTPLHLKTIYAIEKYLNQHPDLHFVKSHIDYYRIMNQAYHPINHKEISLPLDEKTIKKYEKQLSPFLSTDFFANKDRSILKITAQMKDLGKYEIDRIQKDILENINSIIGSNPIDVKTSGIDLLIDISQKKSIESTLWGLLIAIIIVSITLGLVYKSIVISLLAVFLNIIPLLMTAGIIGYFNIDLRAEIALIFTVGFVIAVDDTIHLLSKFQWERKKGLSIEDATKKAILECGKAIIATSIILVGGFFILIGSSSLEIFTLGILVGVIVIITLAVDLILAPVIILTWFKKFL